MTSTQQELVSYRSGPPFNAKEIEKLPREWDPRCCWSLSSSPRLTSTLHPSTSKMQNLSLGEYLVILRIKTVKHNL